MAPILQCGIGLGALCHPEVAHGAAGGYRLGGGDAGLGVYAGLVVEVLQGAGLAKAGDTQGAGAVAVDGTEPAEGGRMAV